MGLTDRIGASVLPKSEIINGRHALERMPTPSKKPIDESVMTARPSAFMSSGR
jgi:hypothetical protein